MKWNGLEGKKEKIGGKVAGFVFSEKICSPPSNYLL